MIEEITYRPAQVDELRVAARVFLLADAEAERRPYGRVRHCGFAVSAAEEEDRAAAALAALHAEAPANVWVALLGGEVVGVAAAAIRERHWLLHYHYVLPTAQRRGIGQELLRRVHAVGVAAGCTVFSLHASHDPAALTRYLALGLTPQPPTIDLRTTSPTFPPPPWDDGLDAHPLRADDAATVETVGDIDRVVRGCRRPADLRRWMVAGATGALLTRRDTGAPAGYYLVGVEALDGRIGPVAALDEARFAAVLGRALAAAASLRPPDRPELMWRALVPGQNRAAVAPLLAAGFRPRLFTAFFSSAPIGRFDRYLFHDQEYL